MALRTGPVSRSLETSRGSTCHDARPIRPPNPYDVRPSCLGKAINVEPLRQDLEIFLRYSGKMRGERKHEYCDVALLILPPTVGIHKDISHFNLGDSFDSEKKCWDMEAGRVVIVHEKMLRIFYHVS